MKLWSSLILSIVCLVVAVTLVAVCFGGQNATTGWRTEEDMARMRGEVIAALVCGVVAVALLITVLVVCMSRKNKKEQEELRRHMQEKQTEQDECANI